MSIHGPVLLSHYQGAADRMRDLPMFNPALTVAMPGWRTLDHGGEAGALITPWCINLLWVPGSLPCRPRASPACWHFLPENMKA